MRYGQPETYMVTATNNFLAFCETARVHPERVPTGDLLEYIRVHANGQAKTVMSMLNMLTEIAHGTSPYKVDPDLKQRKRRQAAELKEEARIVPVEDVLRRLNETMARKIRKAGGVHVLATHDLADCLATKLAGTAAFRATGMACMPVCHIRREPSTASLTECNVYFLRVYAAKGELLSESTAWDAWSPEVPVSQNPKSSDKVYLATRLSVLLTEWIRRITIGIGDRARTTKIHGIDVWCNCIFIPRSGGVRRDGTERWVYQPMMSMHRADVDSRAATVRKRVARVLEEAGLWDLGVRPSDLRKYYATIFYEAWVRPDESQWEDLRRRMRHSSVAVTRKHYIQRRLHESIRVRWETLGLEKLGKLTSEELLGL